MDQKKYDELVAKRDVYVAKLKERYKHFRGVIHESADSEVKYTTIKVYEGFIESINAELKAMEEKASEA